jgi:hypothetical protein
MERRNRVYFTFNGCSRSYRRAHPPPGAALKFTPPARLARRENPCSRLLRKKGEPTVNRRQQGLKLGTKTGRAQKEGKRRTRSLSSPRQDQVGGDLEKMVLLIRTHPGIRPSELNRRLGREQSDGLRNTLIRRGLIRKEKDGRATRYYPA